MRGRCPRGCVWERFHVRMSIPRGEPGTRRAAQGKGARTDRSRSPARRHPPMRLSARRRAAMIAAGALAVAGIAVPVGSAYAATACDVVYATNDWPGGFTANVTIRNLGDPHQRLDAAVRPSPPASASRRAGRPTGARAAATVTATSMPWNGTIADRRPDQHRLQRQLDRQQPQAHRVHDQRRHVRRRTAAATADRGPHGAGRPVRGARRRRAHRHRERPRRHGHQGRVLPQRPAGQHRHQRAVRVRAWRTCPPAPTRCRRGRTTTPTSPRPTRRPSPSVPRPARCSSPSPASVASSEGGIDAGQRCG